MFIQLNSFCTLSGKVVASYIVNKNIDGVRDVFGESNFSISKDSRLTQYYVINSDMTLSIFVTKLPSGKKRYIPSTYWDADQQKKLADSMSLIS